MAVPPPPGYVLETPPPQPQQPGQDDFWGQMWRGAGRTALSGAQAIGGLLSIDRPDVMLNQAADATDRIASLIQAATSDGRHQPPALPQRRPQPPPPANPTVWQQAAAMSPVPGVGQNPLMADVDSMSQLTDRVIAQHSGRPVPAPTESPFGPSTSEKMAVIPGLRDQPKSSIERLASLLGGAAVMAPLGGGGTPENLAELLAAGAGNVTRTAVPAGAAFAAGEGTRMLGGSQDDQALATMGGGIAGGALSGMMTGGPKAAPKVLANAAPNLSAGQQTAVVALMQRAQAAGHPLTLTEAIDYVVPGARTGAVTRIAEGTPAGIERLGPMYAQRSGQTGQMFGKVLDELAPNPPDPRVTAQQAQSAAEGALNATRRATNEPAGPHYKALPEQSIPPDEYARFVGNGSEPGAVAYGLALKAVRGDPILNAGLAHLPDNNMAVVNAVVQQMGKMESGAREAPTNPGGNNTIAGAYKGGAGGMDALARLLAERGELPADWQTARGLVAQGRQSTLTPMQMGPLGDIAGSSGGLPSLDAGQMGGKLLPPNPLEGSTPANVEAAQALGPAGPQVVRARLAQALAAAMRDQKGLPSETAAGTFAQSVAGNPSQSENLGAVVGGLNPSAGDQLANAMEIARASATRRPGASVQADLAQEADINAGGAAGRAVATGASKRMITDRLAGWMERMHIEGNREKIAQAIASNPDEAAKLLQAMEAAKGNTLQGRALAGAARAFLATKPETGQ